MGRVDVNCVLGNWPFRKLYKNTFEDLKKVHKENGIDVGYVSSLNSIFYNDPFEGDEELHETIRDSHYHHILTVNPTLPQLKEDIQRGLRMFDIKGVKIYPDYHGYRLSDKPVEELCSLLHEFGLPLFLSVRLEDERLNYLIQPVAPSVDEISAFFRSHPNNTVLLLTARYAELVALKEHFNSRRNLFFDTSGLKDLLFVIEKLLREINADRLLYGSLHSLYCLRSTLLLVEKACIEDTVKDRILWENAAFLNAIAKFSELSLKK